MSIDASEILKTGEIMTPSVNRCQKGAMMVSKRPKMDKSLPFYVKLTADVQVVKVT